MRRHGPEDPPDDAGPLFTAAVFASRPQSEARRDQGIEHALVGAEHREPGWKARARAALFEFARTHETFACEDLRESCGNAGDVHLCEPTGGPGVEHPRP